jgi:hypothetical protein
MKKEFPGYFSNRTAVDEQLWDDCIFVLDANVLLSLYRYSDTTRRELLQVFSSLADRLWIPYQVAAEYLSNRLSVIGDQVKVYDDAIKKIDSLRKSLQTQNQPPFVSGDVLGEAESIFSKLDAELAGNKKLHEQRINLDEIKDELEILLEEKVGAGFTREKLEEIMVVGKGRYEERIPPGYRDIKKGGESTLFSDRCKPYGDYIVWLQIIERATELAKSVVFVTGDVKEDWWETYQGKTVGPHPQLAQEFYDEVSKDFYMYTPDRFLEKANAYLRREVSQDAVDEIRDVRAEDIEAASDNPAKWDWQRIYASARDGIGNTRGSGAHHEPKAAPWDEGVVESLHLPWDEPPRNDYEEYSRILATNARRSDLWKRREQMEKRIQALQLHLKNKSMMSSVDKDERRKIKKTLHEAYTRASYLDGELAKLNSELDALNRPK